SIVGTFYLLIASVIHDNNRCPCGGHLADVLNRLSYLGVSVVRCDCDGDTGGRLADRCVLKTVNDNRRHGSPSHSELASLFLRSTMSSTGAASLSSRRSISIRRRLRAPSEVRSESMADRSGAIAAADTPSFRSIWSVIPGATGRACRTSGCWRQHAIAGCCRRSYRSTTSGSQSSSGLGQRRSSPFGRSTPASSRAEAAPWPRSWSVRFPIAPRVPTLSPPV